MRKRLAVFITTMSLVLSACACSRGHGSIGKDSSMVPDSQDTTSISLPDSSKDEPVSSSSEAPHTHTYDKGKVTKDPTCEEDGVVTYTCSCGDTKTEPIPAFGHDWEEVEKEVMYYDNSTDDKTITTYGATTTTSVCNNCGEVKTQVEDEFLNDPVPFATHVVTRVYGSIIRGTVNAYGDTDDKIGDIRYQVVNGGDYPCAELVGMVDQVVTKGMDFLVLEEHEEDEETGEALSIYTWECVKNEKAVVLEVYAFPYNATINALQLAAYETDISHVHEFVPSGEDTVVTPATLDTPATAVTTKTFTCDCGEVMTDDTTTLTDAYTVKSAVNDVLKGYGIVDAELQQSGNATLFYKASGLMESTDNLVSDVANRLETVVKGMEGFKVLYPMSRDTGGDTGFTYGYYNAETGTVITVTVTVYNTIKDHTDSFIVMGILYDALNDYDALGNDIKTFIDNYGNPVQEEHTHTAGDAVETVSDVVPATLDTVGRVTVTTTVSCSECGEVLSTDTRVEEDLLTASDAVMYTFYYMTGKQYEVNAAKLSDGTEVRYNALAFQASGVSCEYAMSIVDEVIQDYLGAPAYPMGATPTPTEDGGFQALYAYLNEYTGTFFAIQADIYPDVNASGTEITVVQIMAYLV